MTKTIRSRFDHEVGGTVEGFNRHTGIQPEMHFNRSRNRDWLTVFLTGLEPRLPDALDSLLVKSSHHSVRLT
jgi:hypothetical protein